MVGLAFFSFLFFFKDMYLISIIFDYQGRRDVSFTGMSISRDFVQWFFHSCRLTYFFQQQSDDDRKKAGQPIKSPFVESAVAESV